MLSNYNAAESAKISNTNQKFFAAHAEIPTLVHLFVILSRRLFTELHTKNFNCPEFRSASIKNNIQVEIYCLIN